MVWVILVQDRIKQQILVNEVIKSSVEFHSMCGVARQPMISSQRRFCFRKIGSVMVQRRRCLKARKFPKGNHACD
jgi:hypothetical protein